MSQRAIEQAVGKLVTDGQFRSWFFKDPIRCSYLYGLELSPEELGVLVRIPRADLAALGQRLDEQIRRHQVPATSGKEGRQGGR